MSKRSRQKRSVADGFVNLTARLGAGAANQFSQGTYVSSLITRKQPLLENMYRGSWVVGTVVDAVAEDMTRAGVQLTGTIEPEAIKKIQTALTRLHVWRGLLDGIKWGRLYGGGLSLIVINGQDPSTPLDLRTVQRGQFEGLSIYDRWQLRPEHHDLIQEGPDMGLPARYTVQGEKGIKSLALHHSRVIRHIGVQLPWRQALLEDYWGQSVVERMYDRLMSFDTATMGAANLVHRAHLRTIRLDGLREVLASGGQAEENLISMFQYMAQLQNSEGVTLLDKLDEFDTHSYTFAGLNDVLLQFGQQIAGATGIPLVRLFGQSPAGLNSTGESDLRMYYDNIHAQQEATLRDGLFRILRAVYKSTLGTEPSEDFDFTFAPLWQLSDEQRATIANTTTQAIGMAYEKGIISVSVALKELRQSSETTGLFSNIEDSDITEAEQHPPDAPTETAADPNIDPETTPTDPKDKAPAKPTVIDRLKRFLER